MCLMLEKLNNLHWVVMARATQRRFTHISFRRISIIFRWFRDVVICLARCVYCFWWEQRQRSCMIFLFLFSVWNSSWYNSQRKYLIVSITTLSLFTHLLRSLARSVMLCFACKISNSLGRRSSTNSLLNFSLSSATNMQRRSVRSGSVENSANVNRFVQKIISLTLFSASQDCVCPKLVKIYKYERKEKKESEEMTSSPRRGQAKSSEC